MFYRVQENMIIDNADFNYSDECKYTDICRTKEYQEDPFRYTLIDGEIAINPNYEEEIKEQQKQARNAEIDSKIQELQIMVIPEILNGNIENIKLYNDVIAGLENARP